MSFQPRYYQTACRDAAFQKWDEGFRGTLAWLCTGSGKTVIAAMVAKRAIIEAGGRVLFVAHREDLLEGAENAFKEELHGMQIQYELNIDRLSTYDIHRNPPDAVMGSIASIHRRLEKYPPDFFTHIITDEAHRSAAKSYLKVYHAFPDAKLLHLTATPKRSDKKTLSGYTYDESEDRDGYKEFQAATCESRAFKLSMGDAIEDGWLVEPITRIVNVDVDWSTLKLKGKDYDQGQVDSIMKEDEALHKVAVGLEAIVKGKCGVVFMPGVASAHGLANLLKRSYGIDAVGLDGKTEKHLRRDIIRRAKSGDLECLVNVAVATEGFDSPFWEYMADCQPTKHQGRKIQKIGRCVRPIRGDLFDGIGMAEAREARLAAIAASEKPRSMVLDFVGNMGNLRIVTAEDVLAGELPHKDYGRQPKPTDADVKHVLARRPGMSIQEARQRASDEKYLHELLMAPRYGAKVEGEVNVQEFASFFSIPFVWSKDAPKVKERPAPDKAASDKQKNFIRFLCRQTGTRTPSDEWFEFLTKGQAGAFINSMKERAGA